MTVHDDDDNDFVDDNGHTSNASDDEEEMDQYDDDEEEQKASNDDDEESRLLIMDIDTLYPLLVPLASSAWDVQSPRDRKAILQTIQNQLQHNPIARNFFAEQSKELSCTSIHASRRIISLLLVSIQSESDPTILERLVRGLVYQYTHAKADTQVIDSTMAVLPKTSQQSSSMSNQHEQQQHSSKIAVLRNMLTSIAKQDPNLAMAAIALGFGLGTDIASEDDKDDEWKQLLLQHCTTHLPTARECALARSILSTIGPEEWNDTILPAFVLKLKSHPDRALSTLLGWIEYVPSEALATNNNNNEWMTLLLKHVTTSTKEENRETAARILMVWTQKSSVRVAGTVAVALAESKPALSATARLGVYQVLETIAAQNNTNTNTTMHMENNNKNNHHFDPTIVPKVFQGLVAFLLKEPKLEQRIPGLKAVVEWMIVAKRMNENVGYPKVVSELVHTPIRAKKAADAAVVLGILIQRVHPDELGPLAVDIWMTGGGQQQQDKAWISGVETLLNSAATKKSIIPESLIFVYLALLFAQQHSAAQLPNFIAKLVSAGSSSSKGGESSFLYSQATIDLIGSNEIVSTIVPRIIAVYTQIATSTATTDVRFSPLFVPNKMSVAIRVLATCVMSPRTSHTSGSFDRNTKDVYASDAILGCIEIVLAQYPFVAELLVTAILEQVNDVSGKVEAIIQDTNASRDAREAESNVAAGTIKGQGSKTAPHRGYDSYSVRRVGRLLSGQCTEASSVAKVMILIHAGTSLKNDGHQRAALIWNTLNVIRKICCSTALRSPEDDDVFRQSLAYEVLRIATSSSFSENVKISWSLHEAALSLLLSLGGIACNFSPSTEDAQNEDSRPYEFASRLCIDNFARMLSSELEKSFCRVETLSITDMELYQSPMGSLFRIEGQGVKEATKISSKRLSEEEEWELQMKKELAEKKMSASQGSGALSVEDKKLVEQQDNQRLQISSLLTVEFVRILESIRHLCSSDIEVGNSCLPIVSRTVLASSISACPAIQCSRNLQAKTLEVLTTLGTCVFEIHEDHAPTITVALQLSCTLDQSGSGADLEGRLRVSSLPSPCAPAACVVFEMEQFQDTLSGASFFFLFPIIRAALMGPRTPPGCEAALRVLERHTALLAGPLYDSAVSCIRRDIATSILELLKHDRAQTFHEPTPFEALVACYRTKSSDNGVSRPLTTSDLAPLLDERGALGSKPCRLGSMIALAKIAEDQPKLIKADPLVENRVWFNCFEQDDEIRRNARKCWSIIQNAEASNDKMSDITPPSPLYAAPLLPLLSHSDSSIAQSAANAYAHAMGKHPPSVSRNIELLCKAFIDNFPSTLDSETKNSQVISALKPKATPCIATAPKKISTGLPKKVAPKKSALEVAGISGIGKPKTAVKKKSTHAALLKPKQERTLDDETLASQFITGITTAKQQEKDSPAKIATRIGVLRVVVALCDTSIDVHMDETTLTLLTTFLMAYGIADGDNNVKGAARDALRDIVAAKGGSSEAIAFLLPHLEDILKTGMADENSLGNLPHDKVPKDSLAKDRRKEAAVVALGSVALHLKGAENDEKVESTVDMLMSALKTPSEEVQLSVADTLMKLMKKGRIEERIESILSGLLKDCLNCENSALRRGAAHGLSAAIKGSGIGSLKKYDVVRQLEEACSSGTSNNKEGALFAMELLSSRLGLLFEPYVIVLLPSLLKSFSDSSDHVRNAANNTAGLIMSRLSAHGVKLVMPAVLKAFEDPAWRTKAASINMLGAMSHLAPKQLAVSLPKIVPQLIEAYTDSTHAKVKASADEALNQITTVVKNPEISSISGNLLAALKDPAHCTTKALEVLIQTEFLHAIDSPSLALIVPILHRGLRDRGATTKRFSALIAGNICTMINDPKDFVPYLPTLLPDLQVSLLDPIPDVRSTSAKALGSLTRSLGEHVLLELRPWLISKLREESCSSAERSGAAQGLTEVLIASGTSMVEDTMRSEILPLRNYPEASTREGVLWMLTFLPPAMGQGFTSLIDVSLPALISGLSDDSEPVREVALRAGRVLIRSHGKVHVDKILPSLEAGLGDDDYRIRVSSLSLLGDLLSMIGGTQVVKGEGDTQDDIRKAERAQAQIALVLGSETRKRVLSGLYLARSDSVHMVRQSAVQVWKTVVSATPRTLREILPVLVAKIIDVLASGNAEKTDVAGRCLGDLVSKLGDSVLPQIIPVLRNTLYNGDSYTKRGVCVGLTEVINCSTKDQILRFIEIIVKVVQTALSDDDDGVRNMAAASFQSLHSVVGSRALDEIVPSFLVALEEEDEVARGRALNGLTGILTVRSRELLPYIIPRLIKKPITSNHAEVLTGISNVTGSTLHFHFSTIIPALLEELAGVDGDDEREQRIRTCSRAICASIDTVGVNWLVSEIASKCGSDKPSLRRESCRMFEYFISERSEKQDFFEQVPIIIRELVYRLNDDDAAVLQANHAAFSALSTHVPAEELVKNVEFMRNLLASMVSDARRRKGGVGDGEFLLPGLNMPKGIEPFLPIFSRGILYGSPSIREVSAAGLGELIQLTSSKYLAGPLVVKMTGPLLRIVGDRNPANVKVAILKTLGLVLVKGGPALRAFAPQFQTTFVKALSDPSRLVRIEAIEALSLLMPLSTRVDPLIKELVSGSLGKNAPVEGLAAAAVQTATLEALAAVLEKGGAKAKLPTSIPSALDASKELLSSPDEGIRDAAAKVMGVSCFLLGEDVTHEVLNDEILRSFHESTPEGRHGRACAIRRILASSIAIQPDLLENLYKTSRELLNDDKSSAREAGCIALGATIGRSPNPIARLRASEPDLLKIINNTRETMEMHRAVARCLCLAIVLVDKEKRVDFMGLSLMDACLHMALNSSQRIQYAFNDVLWLALDVESGTTKGLDRYCELAHFDNQRSMKSLHSKVLCRMKETTVFK